MAKGRVKSKPAGHQWGERRSSKRPGLLGRIMGVNFERKCRKCPVVRVSCFVLGGTTDEYVEEQYVLPSGRVTTKEPPCRR